MSLSVGKTLIFSIVLIVISVILSTKHSSFWNEQKFVLFFFGNHYIYSTYSVGAFFFLNFCEFTVHTCRNLFLDVLTEHVSFCIVDKAGAHDKPSEAGGLSRDIIPYILNLLVSQTWLEQYYSVFLGIITCTSSIIYLSIGKIYSESMFRLF